MIKNLISDKMIKNFVRQYHTSKSLHGWNQNVHVGFGLPITLEVKNKYPRIRYTCQIDGPKTVFLMCQNYHDHIKNG